jgi:hypothetical protein
VVIGPVRRETGAVPGVWVNAVRQSRAGEPSRTQSAADGIGAARLAAPTDANGLAGTFHAVARLARQNAFCGYAPAMIQ